MFKRKSGQHHGIERFMTTFVVMSTLLVTTLGAGFYIDATKNSEVLAEKAIYNEEATMSKTNSKVEIKNVFVNKARTKAFVLLHLPDIVKVSTKAEDYQLFMTEAQLRGNNYHRYSKPGASIYVFGQTGYMGIYFTQEAGFQQQVYDVILRANAELLNKADVKRSSQDKRDPSFDKFDQAQFFFNAGATGAIETDAMDKNQLDVEELYKKFVVGPEEEKIRESLTASLKEMRADITAIKEYKRRLLGLSIDGKHIVESKGPKDIEGDDIIEKNGMLYLTTKHTYAKGFNFDWQDSSVVKGYIDKIKPRDKTSIDWLQEINQQVDNKNDGNFMDMDWYLSDGTSLKTLAATSGDLSIVKDATNTVTHLGQAWQKYQQDKRKYQTTELRKLIDLEITLQNVRSNYTLNTNDNVLKMYR